MAETPELFPQPGDDDILEDFDPDDDLGLQDTVVEEPRPYGFTWRFDFNKEDLDFSNGDPPKVTGLGTVNEWISHTINTEIFETPAFDGDIGTPIFKMIGSVLDGYMTQRVKDEIIKAVNIHDRITDVTDVQVFSLGGNIYGFFTYETDDTIQSPALFELR